MCSKPPARLDDGNQPIALGQVGPVPVRYVSAQGREQKGIRIRRVEALEQYLAIVHLSEQVLHARRVTSQMRRPPDIRVDGDLCEVTQLLQMNADTVQPVGHVD